MAHNCVDWNAHPPVRKTPLLVLTHGEDDVYTVIPDNLKALHDIARKEFNLGDVDIHILSPCASLCHGKAARITEDVWGHISPYIGCATVQVSHPRAEEDQEAAPHVGVKRRWPSADTDDQQAPMDTASEHGNDQRTSATEDEEEETSATLPRRHTRRRLVSEDEDREEAHEDPAEPPQSPVAADPTGGTASEEKAGDRSGSQTAEPPDRPIKQEKHPGGNPTQSAPTEAQDETDVQAQVDPGEAQKLMIRVAHRPSNQEAKFMTKSTTSVGKVLSGACRSFKLDLSLATLYLIVTVEDEEGNMESLFPCDKNDTIAKAGAECATESRFLLKITGQD